MMNERERFTEFRIQASLDGEVLPDGVVATDNPDATPSAGPADAGNNVRDVVVERVEHGAVVLIVTAGGVFESDGGGEAVATCPGVGELERIIRTIRNEVVVDYPARITGEGREQ